jgi:regulatory protein
VIREPGTTDVDEKELARAKNAAYRYLSYRPRSFSEVETKLRDKEFSGTVVQRVLDDLARLGYLNDERFADQWAQSRVRLRGLGRRRIERELKNKGIDPETVRRTLADVLNAGVEMETARKAAGRKRSALKALDRETRRRRLAGFLERKGFSFEVIRSILKETD